jgi:hypothetical protein
MAAFKSTLIGASQEGTDVGPGWLQLLGACNARSSLGVPNGFTVAALTFV